MNELDSIFEDLFEEKSETYRVLIESPPATGKTTKSLEYAAKSSTPVTYLAARSDLYSQAISFLKGHEDLTVERIPNPFQQCESFDEEENPGFESIKTLYQKGISAHQIHREYDQEVNLPCLDGSNGCEFLNHRNRILNADLSQNIDVLVGNHQHAYNEDYLEDRIVIFDEFNADPFIINFTPDATQDSYIPKPEVAIGNFLKEVDAIPASDVTDLIELRASRGEDFEEVVDWFRQNGATQKTGRDHQYITYGKYDTTHALAPLLTYSLLLAEKLGPGIEFAGDRQSWREVNANPGTRIVRNRNTGGMTVLQPPSQLSSAEIVIGLDALPTPRLWKTVYDTDFEHIQTVDRSQLGDYIKNELNYRLIQLGDSHHYYSTGNVSPKDQYRFKIARLLADQQFPLISTKRALESYAETGWLDGVIKQDEGCSDNSSIGEHCTLNFSQVLSSNIFAEEGVGLVAGVAYPGHDIIKRYAALSGEYVEPIKESGRLAGFSGFGDQVLDYFVAHKIVQSILRFGRKGKHRDQETQVFLITTALPDWLPPDEEYSVQPPHSNKKRLEVIKQLRKAEISDDSLSQHTVNSLQEAVNRSMSMGNVSRETIRKLLRHDISDVVQIEKDGGRNGADLFSWNGETESTSSKSGFADMKVVESNGKYYFLDSD